MRLIVMDIWPVPSRSQIFYMSLKKEKYMHVDKRGKRFKKCMYIVEYRVEKESAKNLTLSVACTLIYS